jgi:hypothetical protein
MHGRVCMRWGWLGIWEGCNGESGGKCAWKAQITCCFSFKGLFLFLFWCLYWKLREKEGSWALDTNAARTRVWFAGWEVLAWPPGIGAMRVDHETSPDLDQMLGYMRAKWLYGLSRGFIRYAGLGIGRRGQNLPFKTWAARHLDPQRYIESTSPPSFSIFSKDIKIKTKTIL